MVRQMRYDLKDKYKFNNVDIINIDTVPHFATAATKSRGPRPWRGFTHGTDHSKNSLKGGYDLTRTRWRWIGEEGTRNGVREASRTSGSTGQGRPAG